jgi:hypothetical protein
MLRAAEAMELPVLLVRRRRTRERPGAEEDDVAKEKGRESRGRERRS